MPPEGRVSSTHAVGSGCQLRLAALEQVVGRALCGSKPSARRLRSTLSAKSMRGSPSTPPSRSLPQCSPWVGALRATASSSPSSIRSQHKYTEPAQADDAPRRGRSERDREEPDLTHQPERHPPRPAMAPPSSGAGRASPLPRGSELPASQPPVSNLAPSSPRNAPLKLGYWRKVGTICSWWTRPLYGQAG